MREALLRSLTKRRDFDLVFREGKHLASRYLVIYARPNGLAFNRLGLSVGKKLGTAVTRNRIKRLLREAMRKALGGTACRCDFVIVAKRSSVEGRLDDFIIEIKNFLSRFMHEKSIAVSFKAV